MTDYDDVLELLIAPESQDGYGVPKAKAERAVDAFQAEHGHIYNMENADPADIAETIYSTQRYWD